MKLLSLQKKEQYVVAGIIMSNDVKRKVFAIGLAKTGTTSLHFALEELGYRSIHAASTLCAIINWEARLHVPLLSTVEKKYDAFLDWPISCLYPELYDRFPGSKFILTERNSEERYESARRHVSIDRERKNDGKSYAWVELLAKKKFFQEAAEHRRKVRSFFGTECSQDFLVMRITEGDGWNKLCPFLGIDVPSQSFPKRTARSSEESHYVRLQAVEPRSVCVDFSALSRHVASDAISDSQELR